MSTIKLDTSLLPPGGHVLCAVSGGADSVCLLSLLRGCPDITLSAAHFNHCLRGAEADGDEAFVGSLCAEWGIPFYSGRGDVAAYAAEKGLSAETAAREMRYAYLYGQADALGADCIATAHNANDNAETLLLRLARGTGLKGLCGIPRKRGRLIRPLLSVTREEILCYLDEQGIAHREDSTNALDEAARNRIRHHAVPALESVSSGAVRSLCRTAEVLGEDGEYLSAQAREAYARICDGESLSVSGLTALHPALRRRVLELFTNGNLLYPHRQALLKLCEGSENGTLSLPGLTVRRSYDRLLRESGENPPLPERELVPGESIRWGEYRISTGLTKEKPGIQNSFNTFFFAYGRICGKLFLTSRRDGDTILFAHREGTRSLHRLMIDAKIPAPERSAVPVLRDEAGVLAVYGFGRSRRAQPEDGETVLRVTIEKTGKEQKEND